MRALKVINVERALAEKHYSDLSSKPFFKDLVGSPGGSHVHHYQNTRQ